jgi:hypothetical protein
MNATMPGRLKKLNISPASFDNNTFTHVGPVKRAWVYCKRSWKATVWLVRNRGSSTKSDPGGH